jgi:hypothetical protein
VSSNVVVGFFVVNIMLPGLAMYESEGMCWRAKMPLGHAVTLRTYL